jgi:hypothetical protein
VRKCENGKYSHPYIRRLQWATKFQVSNGLENLWRRMEAFEDEQGNFQDGFMNREDCLTVRTFVSRPLFINFSTNQQINIDKRTKKKLAS